MTSLTPKLTSKQKFTKNETKCAPLQLATAKNIDSANAEGNNKKTKSGKFTLAQLRQTEGIVPLQSGTNQYDSQRGMTGFGMPRDVKGKHLKRIWELEFPEEDVSTQVINQRQNMRNQQTQNLAQNKEQQQNNN